MIPQKTNKKNPKDHVVQSNNVNQNSKNIHPMAMSYPNRQIVPSNIQPMFSTFTYNRNVQPSNSYPLQHQQMGYNRMINLQSGGMTVQSTPKPNWNNPQHVVVNNMNGNNGVLSSNPISHGSYVNMFPANTGVFFRKNQMNMNNLPTMTNKLVPSTNPKPKPTTPTKKKEVFAVRDYPDEKGNYPRPAFARRQISVMERVNQQNGGVSNVHVQGTCAYKARGKDPCSTPALPGYRFCENHILADPKAPYLSCNFYTKKMNRCRKVRKYEKGMNPNTVYCGFHERKVNKGKSTPKKSTSSSKAKRKSSTKKNNKRKIEVDEQQEEEEEGGGGKVLFQNMDVSKSMKQRSKKKKSSSSSKKRKRKQRSKKGDETESDEELYRQRKRRKINPLEKNHFTSTPTTTTAAIDDNNKEEVSLFGDDKEYLLLEESEEEIFLEDFLQNKEQEQEEEEKEEVEKESFHIFDVDSQEEENELQQQQQQQQLRSPENLSESEFLKYRRSQLCQVLNMMTNEYDRLKRGLEQRYDQFLSKRDQFMTSMNQNNIDPHHSDKKKNNEKTSFLKYQYIQKNVNVKEDEWSDEDEDEEKEKEEDIYIDEEKKLQRKRRNQFKGTFTNDELYANYFENDESSFYLCEEVLKTDVVLHDDRQKKKKEIKNTTIAPPPIQKQDDDDDDDDDDETEEEEEIILKCSFGQCFNRRMMHSKYCFEHILFDEHQQLYKSSNKFLKIQKEELLNENEIGSPVLVSCEGMNERNDHSSSYSSSRRSLRNHRKRTKKEGELMDMYKEEQEQPKLPILQLLRKKNNNTTATTRKTTNNKRNRLVTIMYYNKGGGRGISMDSIKGLLPARSYQGLQQEQQKREKENGTSSLFYQMANIQKI